MYMNSFSMKIPWHKTGHGSGSCSMNWRASSVSERLGRRPKPGQVDFLDPFFGRGFLGRDLLGPLGGQLAHPVTVHQEQGLGRDGGRVPVPLGRRRVGEIEQPEELEDVGPHDRQVDRPQR